MAPTGARRPLETTGADIELGISAEVVDRSTGKEAGAGAELVKAEGPAEAG